MSVLASRHGSTWMEGSQNVRSATGARWINFVQYTHAKKVSCSVGHDVINMWCKQLSPGQVT